MRRIRRLSPSTLIASVALFVALGGTGYALTIPINSVGTGQLRAQAVHISDLANGAVIRSKLGAGAVGTDQLGTGQVSANKYADASIAGSKLANAVITNPKLASAAVSNSKLGSNSVSASKIGADQVGASELKTLNVRTSTVVVPGGVPAGDGQYSTRSVSKTCNAGELAVGIGYHWDTDNDDDELPIISSRFLISGNQPNGAVVRGGNDTALNRTLTVEVNCLAA
jgi:hypothetical protein